MKACSAFMVIHGHYRGVKTLSHPTPVLSQLRSFNTGNVSFNTLFSATFLYFFVSGLTVENGPQA